MKHTREFEIAWQGLKTGEHLYQYEVDDRFLQEHGGAESGLRNLHAKVDLKFDRQPAFFMLHFDIGGTVTLPCDRCGDDFDLQLWDEFDLLIKLAGEDATEMEEDGDVVFIPRHETVIDLSKWIYEFILLSLPLQRVHPDPKDCNPVAMKLLGQLSDQPPAAQSSLAKGLEALKDNNTKNQNKAK